LVAVVMAGGVERDGLRRRGVALADDAGVFRELFTRHRAHRFASFHLMVELRARQRRVLTGPDDLEAVALPERLGGAHYVGVEARAGADMAGAFTAVAEMHRRAAVGMSVDDKQRTADASAAIAKLDDLARVLPVLAAGRVRLARDAKACRGRRADEDRVVPRQLRHRLRRLLQPAVV